MLKKSELISAIAKSMGAQRQSVERVLDELEYNLSRELKTVGEFSLPGIGKFKVRQVNERMGRNPATGEAKKIEAHNVVKFSPTAQLKEKIR